VKAISQTMNAGAADLHRHEAHITAALAAEASVPQLLSPAHTLVALKRLLRAGNLDRDFGGA
jgi:hypothetical protein